MNIVLIGYRGTGKTSIACLLSERLNMKYIGVDAEIVKKAELSRAFQATTAFIDSSGYCLFIAFAILDIESGAAGMVESVQGFLGDTSIDAVKYGMEVLNAERKFNKKAGFTKVHDRLPEFFKTEPLPPHNVVFEVPDEELDKVFEG